MATGQNPPFTLGASTAYVATSTSVATTFIGSGTGDTVVVTNISSGNLYIWCDGSSVSVAVGSGYCVLPNSQRTIGINPTVASYAAVILDAGTGHAYIERGVGSAR